MLGASILKTGWCEDRDEKGYCTHRDVQTSSHRISALETLPAWHLHDCAAVGYSFALSLLERRFVRTVPVPDNSSGTKHGFCGASVDPAG